MAPEQEKRPTSATTPRSGVHATSSLPSTPPSPTTSQRTDYPESNNRDDEANDDAAEHDGNEDTQSVGTEAEGNEEEGDEEADDGEDEDPDTWAVEDIERDRWARDSHGKYTHMYLVCWAGDWPAEQKRTWEPRENIPKESLLDYHNRKEAARDPSYVPGRR